MHFPLPFAFGYVFVVLVVDSSLEPTVEVESLTAVVVVRGKLVFFFIEMRRIFLNLNSIQFL